MMTALQFARLPPLLAYGYGAYAGGRVEFPDSKFSAPRPNCFKLFVHCERRAASRAAWTAGKSRAIRTAMMAMTTSNSIRVNPRRVRLMSLLHGQEKEQSGIRIGLS